MPKETQSPKSRASRIAKQVTQFQTPHESNLVFLTARIPHKLLQSYLEPVLSKSIRIEETLSFGA